jgi:hypothetical protein
LAIDHGNPDLFRLGCVNQHLFHDNIQLATQLGGAEAVFASCTCDLATSGEISYRGALGRSGVLVTLPATRLWRPDSQSAPRHLVSRVSLCLPRGARTAIGAGGLGAVDSQFSCRYGRSRKGWACRTDKKVRERLGGGPAAIAVLRASPPEAHLLRRRTVAP